MKKLMKKFKKERDILLCYHGQIQRMCIQHMTETMLAKGEFKLLCLADFTFKYNIHTCTSFYVNFINKQFVDKQEAVNIEEVSAEWTKHFEKFLMPQYEKEIEILKTELNKEKPDGAKGIYS